MNDQQVRTYFDQLAGSIEVGPAPVDAVREAGTGHRARILAGVAVAGLVAAAVLAVALSNRNDGPPRPVDPATVTDSVGPIESQSGNGAWWTPGSIHFGTGTLPFDDVDDPADDVGWMVPAPDGVIVGRVDGTIAAVETSGRVTELGRYRTSGQTGQGPSFFVDRTDGLIAWTDGDRLFVYDPASRTVVAERDDSARYPHAAWLLGFDGGKVYWDDRYGDRIWDWAADTTRRVGGGASYIHSVRDGRWLIEVDRGSANGGYGVVEANAGEESAVRLPAIPLSGMPGFSPDGAKVAAVIVGPDADSGFVYRSYGPSAPGTELELPPGRLSAITWLDDGSLFVVLLQPNSETRALATCSAATGACTTQQSLDGRVVIAGDAVQELIPQ